MTAEGQLQRIQALTEEQPTGHHGDERIHVRMSADA
jgi:hypothetical protein